MSHADPTSQRTAPVPARQHVDRAPIGAEPEAAPISSGQLRDALSHFATGVTVITSLGSAAEPVGTTASAVSSLSLDPPLLLVCLGRASTTLAAIRRHGAFAVNVLAAAQHELSGHFARSGAAASWASVSHRVSRHGLPLLTGALASVECAVERCVDGGDHEIVIGRVRGLDVTSGNHEPLVHYRGSYAAILR